MSSWSQRRKFAYVSVITIVFLVAIAIPAFFLIYKAPTCFDGMQNGGETGVDCGGTCQRLCPSAFLAPDVAWTRFEQVTSGLYNVAAYIVNPNISGEAIKAPYHIALYDDRGVLISDVVGKVTLPPHRNTLAFQGAVSTGKRVPTKALFEFTQSPDWHKKADPLSGIVIVDKQYSEGAEGGALSVTLRNSTAHSIGSTNVYVILYDRDGNALGFSKTIIDEIPAFSNVLAPFTWPLDRQGKVISIEVLPVSE